MTVLQEQANFNSFFLLFLRFETSLTTALKTLKSGKNKRTLNNKQTLNYVNLNQEN